jgi:hypothetical protein
MPSLHLPTMVTQRIPFTSALVTGHEAQMVLMLAQMVHPAKGQACGGLL